MSNKERDEMLATDAEPAKYEVGYGRPPRTHQFKPGKSGNPGGRPKGAKSDADIVQSLLNRKLEVRDGGRVRKITILEAIYLQCIEHALKGDIKTAAFLFNRYAAAQAGEAQPGNEMSKDDREVLEAFTQRFAEQSDDKE
jgi:Family of unknown function (DUF5681)